MEFFDAVDRLFDGDAHGVGDDLGAGPRVAGGHLDGGRHDVRGTGTPAGRYRHTSPQNDDDDGDDVGEDGPVDEKGGDHGAGLFS